MLNNVAIRFTKTKFVTRAFSRVPQRQKHKICAMLVRLFNIRKTIALHRLFKLRTSQVERFL